MKKYKTKIISGIVIIAALAFAFWWGGDAPSLRGWNIQKPSAVQTPEEAVSQIAVKGKNEEATAENKPQHKNSAPMTAAEKEEMAERIAEAEKKVMAEQITGAEQAEPIEVTEDKRSIQEEMTSQQSADTPQEETKPQEIKTEAAKPIETAMPLPTEVPMEKTDLHRTCTLSVRCDTILQNMAWLDAEKTELIPSDGVIYAEKEVVFYEGESVFNLLLREMKQNKIHMEFKNIPLYESAYIEGIHNIYEFDCGELSGWMYKVNGVFPGFGCSQYKLEIGDKVEWVYTCDMGVDVGGHYAARNGRK